MLPRSLRSFRILIRHVRRCRLGQVRLGYYSKTLSQVWLGQVRIQKPSVRLGQVNIQKSSVRLSQVRLLFKNPQLGQVRRLGQVRLGQVRLGQVRLGQVKLGQVIIQKPSVRLGLYSKTLGQVTEQGFGYPLPALIQPCVLYGSPLRLGQDSKTLSQVKKLFKSDIWGALLKLSGEF